MSQLALVKDIRGSLMMMPLVSTASVIVTLFFLFFFTSIPIGTSELHYSTDNFVYHLDIGCDQDITVIKPKLTSICWTANFTTPQERQAWDQIIPEIHLGNSTKRFKLDYYLTETKTQVSFNSRKTCHYISQCGLWDAMHLPKLRHVNWCNAEGRIELALRMRQDSMPVLPIDVKYQEHGIIVQDISLGATKPFDVVDDVSLFISIISKPNSTPITPVTNIPSTTITTATNTTRGLVKTSGSSIQTTTDISEMNKETSSTIIVSNPSSIPVTQVMNIPPSTTIITATNTTTGLVKTSASSIQTTTDISELSKERSSTTSIVSNPSSTHITPVTNIPSTTITTATNTITDSVKTSGGSIQTTTDISEMNTETSSTTSIVSNPNSTPITPVTNIPSTTIITATNTTTGSLKTSGTFLTTADISKMNKETSSTTSIVSNSSSTPITPVTNIPSTTITTATNTTTGLVKTSGSSIQTTKDILELSKELSSTTSIISNPSSTPITPVTNIPSTTIITATNTTTGSLKTSGTFLTTADISKMNKETSSTTIVSNPRSTLVTPMVNVPSTIITEVTNTNANSVKTSGSSLITADISEMKNKTLSVFTNVSKPTSVPIAQTVNTISPLIIKAPKSTAGSVMEPGDAFGTTTTNTSSSNLNDSTSPTVTMTTKQPMIFTASKTVEYGIDKSPAQPKDTSTQSSLTDEDDGELPPYPGLDEEMYQQPAGGFLDFPEDETSSDTEKSTDIPVVTSTHSQSKHSSLTMAQRNTKPNLVQPAEPRMASDSDSRDQLHQLSSKRHLPVLPDVMAKQNSSLAEKPTVNFNKHQSSYNETEFKKPVTRSRLGVSNAVRCTQIRGNMECTEGNRKPVQVVSENTTGGTVGNRMVSLNAETTLKRSPIFSGMLVSAARLQQSATLSNATNNCTTQTSLSANTRPHNKTDIRSLGKSTSQSERIQLFTQTWSFNVTHGFQIPPQASTGLRGVHR